MVRRKWHGQNGIDQNGMEKMVWTKWYTVTNGTDKIINQLIQLPLTMRFFINPASTLAPLDFLCVLVTNLWLLEPTPRHHLDDETWLRSAAETAFCWKTDAVPRPRTKTDLGTQWTQMTVNRRQPRPLLTSTTDFRFLNIYWIQLH